MIQLTDKLFAILIPENSTKLYPHKWSTDSEFDDTVEMDVEPYFIMIGFKFSILGTCSKDTIDFNVEPMLDKHNDICRHTIESQGIFYKDYTVGDYIFSIPEASFRSLLTSKGCNPDEKHLIIEKI